MCVPACLRTVSYNHSMYCAVPDTVHPVSQFLLVLGYLAKAMLLMQKDMRGVNANTYT
jgi:hypothetical protein